MNTQTFFESGHALENAEVMLDVCREEYERAGSGAAVQALRGLDVKSLSSAQLALMTVRSIPAEGGLVNVKRYTIEALTAALRELQTAPRLAS